MKPYKTLLDSCTIILEEFSSKNRSNGNSKQITVRYRELVDYITRLDSNAEIQINSNDAILVLFPVTENDCRFYLKQFPGILSVEFVVTGEGKGQYEWIFAENKACRHIFRQIINDILNHPLRNGVYPRLLETMNMRKHPVNIDMGINFFELTLLKDEAPVIFCIAWNGMLIMDRIKDTTIEGKFEILFFNCLLALSYVGKDENELSKIREGLVPLLIFYLEKHQLAEQFDLELLISQRIDFYSGLVKEMDTRTRSTCYALYYFFYIKPLYRKTNVSLLPIEHEMIANLLLMNENIRKKVALYLNENLK
jgi:hypothetical protein